MNRTRSRAILALFCFSLLSPRSEIRAQPVPTGELVRVRTDDGVILHGARWSPPTGGGRLGVALCSGTGSEFYDD